MSLKSKLYIIALLAVGLAIVCAAFINATKRNENTLILHTEYVESVLQTTDNLQAALREYGLASTPANAEHWLSLHSTLQQYLDNPPQVSINMQPYLSSALALNKTAHTLFQRLLTIDDTLSSANSDPQLLANAKKALGNRLYLTLNLISDESLNLSFGALLDFKRKSSNINQALKASVFTVSILNVLIALYFVYTFSGRMNQLLSLVQGVASGDLDTRALASGKDELAKLAVQFNNMTSKLQESMVARTELEQMIDQATAELEAQKQKLHQMAHYDSLTEIGNRALFNSTLEHAFKRAQRSAAKLAVLYIDIDGFKLINDNHGHNIGDEVLKLVARKFTSTIRASDVIARLGGDEFAIIMEELKGREDAETLASKLRLRLAAPQKIRDHIINIDVSIGIALYPDDAASIEDLIRSADSHMYTVKHSSRAYS
ncbi:diguanylate cyclase [Pseudomaricurvus alcaniphilus]|uniref:diguanylate cyclase domain-containing protein n=1 Tax=Pseudomaricurvus alcaniphilus TaxID=1166482 RepID=UPI0014081099|nr:diguanylate cyclase [Pseudomaricurvus alcaniphilus]NHN36942.1 diguanylate cyclase [Pseudomaricurvus alcaniphilus]